MLLIAGAYRALNRADPDAGTTFAWTTRALGPGTGWVNGWAIFLSDVIVMASLAEIAGRYTFLLFDWNSAANSQVAVMIAAVVWIALMTWICYRGIELSARTQQFLLGAEIVILHDLRGGGLRQDLRRASRRRDQAAALLVQPLRDWA